MADASSDAGGEEMHVDYLLIGGLLASVTAAEALRDAGARDPS
jgi:hypothetical protein